MSRANVVRLSSNAALSGDDCRLLIESVVDYAIFMLDTDGHVMTWNPGAERIKGWPADEIIGQHFSKFFTPEDVAAKKPEMELAQATKLGRFEDDGWRVRKDGTRFWANVVITALRDEAGSLRGFGKVTRDMSARHAAEQGLRQAEQRFHQIVDAVVDYAIFMLDETGHVATWNPGARRLKGYEAPEIIGKHFSAFYTPEDRAAGKPERVLETVRREGRFEEEGWRVKKDGSLFWANVVINALRDDTGKVVGFVKITRDLTTRREADRAERYRDLSERLSGILEGIDDGVTVHDRSGHIVFSTSTAKSLFDGGTVTTDGDGAEITADDLPWRRALAGKALDPVLLRVVDRATGLWTWTQVRTTSVLGADGKPELAITVFHDVTETHRREQSERTIARATIALSSSLDKNTLLAAFGKTLAPSFADTTSVFVLEGKALRDVVSNKPPAQVHWNVARTGKLEVAARSVVVPIFVRAKLVGAVAIANAPEGRVFDHEDVLITTELARRAGVAIDNSDLYKIAQDAARRAEDASRAKDEFLATVSHELRTPLNAIVGWATILKERHLDAEIARPIEVIHRNAVAQMKIVDDILDVSRVITGKFRLDPQPSDLLKIAEDAIDVVRPSALAKQIDVQLVRETSHCMLVVDPERMRQALWNLLSNAVKFTDTGGKITVSVACDETEARVVVRDTGRGIEPEFLPYVFEPFKQADSTITRKVGGLGLGLALVRHFVELHGGAVTVASEGAGKGATFTITLPLRAEPKPEDHEETNGVHRLLTGVRVLVVDDEVDARELVAAVLSQAGADVEMAASAAEGMTKLASFQPTMIISDIGMPVEDGYAFMRRVRATSSAPSMALTAFASDADRARAMDAGYTMHVAKPIDPDVLVTTVAMLARRGAS